MVWPFKKKDEAPNPIQVVSAQGRRDILNEENRSVNAEMNAASGIAFDFQVIDDEKILDLFDESKPLFHPLLMPLLPLVSRLNFLSNCGEREKRGFILAVDIAIARLKNKASSSTDYMLLDNLKTYLHMRINDSLMGFKIRVLTERKKSIDIREELVKKKSGLGGLLG